MLVLWVTYKHCITLLNLTLSPKPKTLNPKTLNPKPLLSTKPKTVYVRLTKSNHASGKNVALQLLGGQGSYLGAARFGFRCLSLVSIEGLII